MTTFSSCKKNYSTDQDKALSPQQTVRQIKERLKNLNMPLVQDCKRIDQGRLGIPVFLSVCGREARVCMPTRKQMGKGASPEQAEASAVMELMERFGFFSYFQNQEKTPRYTWEEAERLFGSALLPLEQVIASCHDTLPVEQARELMNLRQWLFVPATCLTSRETVYVPADLFRQLGEFNGSSAGNTDVESILQGLCEVIERHVCALADRHKPVLPTISLEAPQTDPVLERLVEAFRSNGIILILKDLSSGMPVPTVGALAYDPATFPHASEIVFTAGTATSPAKAALRAITEVAQLAGDFCSQACYEASGLPKYASWEETAWLRQGEPVPLASLPSIERDDMLDELNLLTSSLRKQGYEAFTIDTTHPVTHVPSHYTIVPGMHFRERDRNASLGLFLGRMLTEQDTCANALQGLKVIERHYPQAHFLPFFHGITSLKTGERSKALDFFVSSIPNQPDADAQALAAFYAGYTLSLDEMWQECTPFLRTAVNLCPDMKEYLNLLGVSLFKQEQYSQAAELFADIIKRLDKGSATDLQNLGACHFKLGDKAAARTFLEAALLIDPSLEGAAHYLALLSGHKTTT